MDVATNFLAPIITLVIAVLGFLYRERELKKKLQETSTTSGQAALVEALRAAQAQANTYYKALIESDERLETARKAHQTLYEQLLKLQASILMERQNVIDSQENNHD